MNKASYEAISGPLKELNDNLALAKIRKMMSDKEMESKLAETKSREKIAQAQLDAEKEEATRKAGLERVLKTLKDGTQVESWVPLGTTKDTPAVSQKSEIELAAERSAKIDTEADKKKAAKGGIGDSKNDNKNDLLSSLGPEAQTAGMLALMNAKSVASGAKGALSKVSPQIGKSIRGAGTGFPAQFAGVEVLNRAVFPLAGSMIDAATGGRTSLAENGLGGFTRGYGVTDENSEKARALEQLQVMTPEQRLQYATIMKNLKNPQTPLPSEGVSTSVPTQPIQALTPEQLKKQEEEKLYQDYLASLKGTSASF